MTRPDLVIVSDLHLCDGGPREDFRPEDDRAFAGLLDELAEHTPIELVVNGDFIDFIQIQPRPEMWSGDDLDASEPESVEKLELALAAHAEVFDAMQRFVARGGVVRFHYGNHDIDLVWPEVQRRLRTRLADDDSTVQFAWAYATGGLYIEHGHQADPANSFAEIRSVVHRDALGMPRLERPWGTRLVEEFYNHVEELDGLEMLDNVRPRLRAVAIIVGYGLRQPRMYPALRRGLGLIVKALATIRSDEEIQYAAEQVGLPPGALRMLAAAAGFLGLRAPSPAPAPPNWAVRPVAASGQEPATEASVAKAVAQPGAVGRGRLQAPSLQQAYRIGQTHSGDPLQLELDLHEAGIPTTLSSSAAGMAAFATAAANVMPGPGAAVYRGQGMRKFLERASQIAAARPGLAAVCFGHTHLATDARLQVDGRHGWPLPGTDCRYYNSGSWTRSMNLSEPRWSDASFEDLQNPANFHPGREIILVRWRDEGGKPEVMMHHWEAE